MIGPDGRKDGVEAKAHDDGDAVVLRGRALHVSTRRKKQHDSTIAEAALGGVSPRGTRRTCDPSPRPKKANGLSMRLIISVTSSANTASAVSKTAPTLETIKERKIAI